MNPHTSDTPTPLLRIARHDSIAILSLNRPESMNALSPALLTALDQAVVQLAEATDVRAVIITGEGAAFCAGGDLLSFREALTDPTGDSLIANIAFAQDVFSRIEALPMPVIAAVNGHAIAGGLELLLCCDLVVASSTARIGDGHARFGIIPGGGASVRLPQKLTANRANYLLLSGDLLPAQTLADWGLVNEVVAPDALLDAALALAARLARHSPLGLRHIKGLAAQATHDTEAGLRAELDAFRQYAKSQDFAEGLAAFADKRQPTFTGN